MTPHVSISTVWEALKAFLRGQIISFMANKKKKSQAKQLELSEQIAQLDKSYAQHPSPNLYKEQMKLKADYDLVSSYSTENLLLRNKSTIYEYGEKAGEILAKQLRGARAKQIISGVVSPTGKVTIDQQEINNVFKDYYCKLYTSNNSSNLNAMQDFFKDLRIPSLSPDQVSNLDKPFTQREITEAIKWLQTRKSPGPDGRPSEFYVTFSMQLTPILSAMFSD